MNRYAIYHRAHSSCSHLLEDGSLCLKLKAVSGDISKLEVLIKERYSKMQSAKLYRLKKIQSDINFDYFEIKISKPPQRIAYIFLITDPISQTYILDDSGLYKSLNKNDDYSASFVSNTSFQIPQVLKSEIIQVPTWINNCVCYQIFVDRFARSSERSTKGLMRWGSKPTRTSIAGGDFKGIEEHIHYLSSLGISCVYFTPLFFADSNHKYDTIDYFAIDPSFGTIDTFSSMIQALRKAGIRVILDLVFNHSGINFFAFQDIIAKGKNSKYKDWYYLYKDLDKTSFDNMLKQDTHTAFWERTGTHEERGMLYDTFAHTPYMPKLNTENKSVQKYLLHVTEYWLETFSLDGFRLDVANEISFELLRKFRKLVKGINPNALIVGEVWHNASPWLQGECFDSVMNYPFSMSIFNLLIEQSISLDDFIAAIHSQIFDHYNQINKMMLNLLESHDTQRLYTRAKKDSRVMLLAYSLLFTLPGIPMIYYGSEIGLEGGDDPDCRRCMVWDKDTQNLDLFHAFQFLIKIKNTFKVLSDGDTNLTKLSNDILFVTRSNTYESISLICNTSKTAIEIDNFDFDRYELIKKTAGKNKSSEPNLVKISTPFRLEAFEYQYILRKNKK